MHGIFDFISSYGYLAVYIGSIFEGETVVLLAGALSHEDYISFPFVILWAFLGAITGDTVWFLLGRYHGIKFFKKWKWFNMFMDKPLNVVNKNPVKLAFFMRFMYGFRHIVPVSLGISSISTKTFLFWNGLGGLCWSIVVASAGFISINIVEEIVGNLRRYELKVIIFAVISIVTLVLLGRLLKSVIRSNVEK